MSYIKKPAISSRIIYDVLNTWRSKRYSRITDICSVTVLTQKVLHHGTAKAMPSNEDICYSIDFSIVVDSAYQIRKQNIM